MTATLTRRELAERTVVFAGFRALPSHGPILAAQGYIWVQQLRLRKEELAGNLEGVLSRTRGAGYCWTELPSEFLRQDLRERTTECLRKTGLQLSAVSTGGTMHEAVRAERALPAILELARAAKGAGALGVVLNASPKPNDALKSDEELATQARFLNQLGMELQALGLYLAIHQHAAEMAEGAREWRYDLRHTDPRLVSFCVDVPWVHLGGQDPLVLVREAGPRLASLHLRNLRQGVRMETFGDGDIDYRPIAAHLKEIGFRGALVVELGYQPETKVTRSIEDNLRLSRLYAQRIFGIRS